MKIKSKGILYIVPTPIGNLKDVTLRALEILESVDLIGAEDTRTSGYFLKHYQIKTPMISYHKFNERSRVRALISRLNNGENIAIISDAGTPGISDPSKIIIQEAIKEEIKVDVLPGATALIPAIVNSGLDGNRFCFNGFLPDKERDRNRLFAEICNLSCSQVFYVSPHKIKNFLQLCLSKFGDRECSIGREISKLHETHYRGLLSQFVEEKIEIVLKGEFVVIISGKINEEITDEEIVSLLRDKGTDKNVLKEITELYNVKRNRLYRIALSVKEQKN